VAVGRGAMTRIDGPRVPPAYGGPARQLVVLLHGYGADGNDLIGLAPHWAKMLPGAAFVSPHGPSPCAMAPMGRQWFSLDDYDPDGLRRDPARMAERYERMAAGASETAPVLDAFIDAERDRHGLGDAAVALVGFSQGTMMALHVALRREKPLAAVVGYSGALLGAGSVAEAVRSRPPVLLFHGDADEVVPIHALFHAVHGLSDAGLTVQWHVCPGVGHGIDPDGLAIGGRFLADAFSGQPMGGEVTPVT
jgi:phospholipase/carboxylesterase